MNAVTLKVRGLDSGFAMADGTMWVVENIDLELRRGEVLGLIGESGSGKTVSGMAILRLLPGNAETRAKTLEFQGRDTLSLSGEAFRELRGNHMAMVFQDPVGAFNPAKKIAWHMRGVYRRTAGRSAAHRARAANWRGAAAKLLAEVGIPNGADVLNLYPHQLSGGMLQRTLIAMVLAFEPELIVADEPTTNLDNIVERQILRLFRDLQNRLNSAFLFITHDMAIAASLCDRIAVMYAGRIVEHGPTRAVFSEPKHPYTQGLLATALALERPGQRLTEIPGDLPSPAALPPGCLFAPRCIFARPDCRMVPPPLIDIGEGRTVRCVLYGDG